MHNIVLIASWLYIDEAAPISLMEFMTP